MKSNETPELTIKEFVESGLLQEANRLFFNPAGLALTVISRAGGVLELGKIIDYRKSPDKAIIPGSPVSILRKAILVNQQVQNMGTIRVETLGYTIQPLREMGLDIGDGENENIDISKDS